jgi:hypothetical protein
LRPFGDPEWHAEFTPERIVVTRGDASLERSDPRASFAGHALTAAWDPLQEAYFNGYSLWLCVTMPFLLAREGVKLYEVEPWIEGSETWSVLRAEFSGSIATHSRVQDFFFGDDLLLRRHDYDVDICGGFAAAELVHGYIMADGIRLPSRRYTYLRTPERQPDFNSLMVSTDVGEVRFA